MPAGPDPAHPGGPILLREPHRGAEPTNRRAHGELPFRLAPPARQPGLRGLRGRGCHARGLRAALEGGQRAYESY